jgi:hypothetical protein
VSVRAEALQCLFVQRRCNACLCSGAAAFVREEALQWLFVQRCNSGCSFGDIFIILNPKRFRNYFLFLGKTFLQPSCSALKIKKIPMNPR